jgi:uncharacterized protein
MAAGWMHRDFRFALARGSDTLRRMSTVTRTSDRSPRRTISLVGVAVLAAIAVGGLYYVKWNPYYHKAFLAATRHSIGASIVSGQSAAPPAPSLAAALGYAWAYGASIWQAMVLGLLLGAGVQALVPRDWLVHVFGTMRFRGVALAGLASAASMM